MWKKSGDMAARFDSRLRQPGGMRHDLFPNARKRQWDKPPACPARDAKRAALSPIFPRLQRLIPLFSPRRGDVERIISSKTRPNDAIQRYILTQGVKEVFSRDLIAFMSCILPKKLIQDRETLFLAHWKGADGFHLDRRFCWLPIIKV